MALVICFSWDPPSHLWKHWANSWLIRCVAECSSVLETKSCCSRRSNYSCQFFQHEKTTSFRLYKKQIVSIQKEKKRNNNLYVMNSVVIVKLVNLVIRKHIFTGRCWEEGTVYTQVQEYFMNEQTKTWLLNIRTGQMTSRLSSIEKWCLNTS